MKKINLVISANMCPLLLDRGKEERYTFNLSCDPRPDGSKLAYDIGIDFDKERSKNYTPYWHRTLKIKDAILLRDALTYMINESKE